MKRWGAPIRETGARLQKIKLRETQNATDPIGKKEVMLERNSKRKGEETRRNWVVPADNPEGATEKLRRSKNQRSQTLLTKRKSIIRASTRTRGGRKQSREVRDYSERGVVDRERSGVTKWESQVKKSGGKPGTGIEHLSKNILPARDEYMHRAPKTGVGGGGLWNYVSLSFGCKKPHR